MKAFLVDCDGENGAQIYFAKTRGQAKAQAANEEECRITEVVSCKRAPELDKYAPGPVPYRVLMEMGWWFECYGCSRHVTLDEMYDYENDEELEPIIEDKAVWCSVGCKHRHLISEAQRKIESALLEIQVIRSLEVSFPSAVFQGFWGNPSVIFFKVPGCKESISWQTGSKFVGVAPIDREAWNRYEDFRLAEVHEWENEGGLVA